MIFVLYIDNKKSGKKNVIVLTTMHAQVKVTNDQRKKAHMHLEWSNERWSWYCWSLVNKSFNQNEIEEMVMNPIIFIKIEPNIYAKIALLKANKHLLVIYTMTFNAL